MPAPEVKVKIGGDNTDLANELKKSEGLIGNFTNSAKSLLTGLAASAAAVALGEFFKSAFEEAGKAELGVKRLGVAVTNAGQDFRTLEPTVEAVVSKLVRLTTYTDDDLRAALTNMIGLTGNVAGSLKNLSLVTDLAAFKQIPLEEASVAVAKAMNGNVTAFNRMGIAGKDAIEVMGEARKQFSGYAENEGKTFSGALTRITNEWGEFKESVGTAILKSGAMEKATNAVVDALVNLQGWIVKNEDGIGNFTTSVARLVSQLGGFIGKIIELDVRLGDSRAWRAILSFFNRDLPEGVEKGLSKAQDIEKDYQASGERMAAAHVRWLNDVNFKGEDQRTADAEKSAKERQKIAEAEAEKKERLVRDTNILLTRSEQEMNKELAKQKVNWDVIASALGAVHEEYIGILPLPKELTDYTDTSRKHVEEMNAALKDQEAKWTKNVDGALAVARGLLDGAHAMGVLSDGAANALNSVLNLASAVKQIAGGDIIGGIVGVVGSLANVLAGLGNSAAEKARQGIIQHNTDALLKNADALSLRSPGTTIAATKTALAAAQKAATDVKGTAFEKATIARDQFIKSLIAQGVSLSDAQQLIKDLGIEGFDSRDAKTFLSSLTAAGQKVGSITPGFGQDFAGQFDFAKQSKDILGLNDNQQLQQFKDLAAKFSPALAKALDVDLSTPEGRAQATKNLQGLFAQLNAGTLSASDIGVSGGQFLQLIQALLPLLTTATGLQGLPGLTAPSLSPSVASAGAPSISSILSAAGSFGGAVTSNTVTGDQQIGPFYITANDQMSTTDVAKEVAQQVSSVLGKRFSDQNVALGTPLVGGVV